MENTSNYDSLNQKIRKLQESEERFRSIVEHSNEAIVVAQDKTVKYSNPRVSELTGYTQEEMRTRDFVEFIHPEDREIVLREYQSRLSGERPTSKYSVRIITKDGQVKYVFVSSALIEWDGNPATLAMITDITELKNVEKGLLQSEERFRSIIGQSPFPIELLTPDGKIFQVNPSWYKLWGVDEVVAAETMEKYNMITDPQVKELGIANLVKKAFTGEHIILPPIIYDANQTAEDFEIENLEGLKSPWIQCHLYPIKDANGELEFMVNTYVDITDLKEAEKNIRQSEERFRHIMEFSPLSITIFTPDGKISQVNAAWKKLWGLSEEEADQVMANYNFLTDKQIEAFGLAPLVERAFKGEHIILPPMDYKGTRTTENIGLEDIEAYSRKIQTHIYSVKGADGEIDYVVGINMDLTELKQAELEAQEQREALARMDRATRMGQLTGSIAHELNQPLTGILGNAQAAEMMLKSKKWKREDYVEIIADIIADTKRAGDVIRNLRELYREHKGDYTPVDINSVAEEAIRLLHSDFVIKQVKLISKLVPSVPLVNGNRFQLQQVLVNLIMNGEQAMSNVAQDDRKLHIATTFDEDGVKFWVDDFGPGIEEDKIEHIFEPLVTWKPGGTGMGLAISNSILEAHGGRMWAENRSEGGAHVGFTLPVIKKDKKK